MSSLLLLLWTLQIAIFQGVVNGKCRCSISHSIPKPVVAPECYSPEGKDCTWYRNCLEKRHPCQGTKDGYAIEYAEKYCNLFSDNYNNFSPIGRCWIDAVRKCLQVALVSTLRQHITCQKIREIAVQSHSRCYVSPKPICDLPYSDLAMLFSLINGALVDDFRGTTQQISSVIKECLTAFVSRSLRIFIKAAKKVVDYINKGREAFKKVVDYIANKFNWVRDRLDWILDDDDSDSANKRQLIDEETGINLLLVDLVALNITNGTTPIPYPQGRNKLAEAIVRLADAVSNGELSNIPVNINGTDVTLEVFSVGLCSDDFCNSTNVTIIGEGPPTSGDSESV